MAAGVQGAAPQPPCAEIRKRAPAAADPESWAEITGSRWKLCRMNRRTAPACRECAADLRDGETPAGSVNALRRAETSRYGRSYPEMNSRARTYVRRRLAHRYAGSAAECRNRGGLSWQLQEMTPAPCRKRKPGTAGECTGRNRKAVCVRSAENLPEIRQKIRNRSGAGGKSGDSERDQRRGSERGR